VLEKSIRRGVCKRSGKTEGLGRSMPREGRIRVVGLHEWDAARGGHPGSVVKPLQYGRVDVQWDLSRGGAVAMKEVEGVSEEWKI